MLQFANTKKMRPEFPGVCVGIGKGPLGGDRDGGADGEKGDGDGSSPGSRSYSRRLGTGPFRFPPSGVL